MATEKGTRSTLAEANEQLKNCMLQRRAMSDAMKSIDKDIMELKVKRILVCKEQDKLYEGPWEAAVQTASRAWIQKIFQHMQRTIPREIRDMIYAQLWNFTTIYEIRTVILMRSERMDTDYLKIRPQYMNPEVVGQDVALEVTESWCKAASDEMLDVFKVHELGQLEFFICGDPFSLGLDSSVALRALTIAIPMDEFALRGNANPALPPRYMELLLKIKRKAGFRLTIKLEQRRIRFKSWLKAFDSIMPVVELFEKENAHVRVFFYYDNASVYPPIDIDLLGRIRDPDWDWMPEVMDNFDIDHRIRDRHRLYRYEDKPDFDPYDEEYFTSTESEFDPTDPWQNGMGNFGFDEDEDYESYVAYDEDEDMYLSHGYFYDDIE